MSETTLPPAVREQALRLLTDYLAVARRGAESPAATAAATGLALLRASGPAIVEGTAERTGVLEAALLNGIAAHAIELDDTHEGASLHPGVAVWPAVLAMADARGASLDEILVAGVRGYDVMCALGADLGPAEVYARGFHPTGVCGPAGAAAAVAQLLGADDDGVTRAVLLATSAASGLLTFLDGAGSTKPLQAGHAASAGVQAALLATAGFAAPHERDGMDRFLGTFGRGPEAAAGERPLGHGVLETSIKLYPCCRYMHGCIDLLLDLDVPVADIERVECAVLPGGWDLVATPMSAKRRPASATEAQFSMPFGAASALELGRFGLAEVDQASALGGSLAGLMDRVDCVHDEALDAAYPRRWGGAVRLTTRDGQELTRRADDFLGSPGLPASDAVVRDKVEGLAGADWADAALAFAGAPRLDALTQLRAA
jgi:2-methylcitrate dehydratase PrpD